MEMREIEEQKHFCYFLSLIDKDNSVRSFAVQ